MLVSVRVQATTEMRMKMKKIEVNVEELETSINELVSKIQAVSTGEYVTNNIFQETKSSSSETLN